MNNLTLLFIVFISFSELTIAKEYTLKDLISIAQEKGIDSEIQKAKVLEIEAQIDQSKSDYYPKFSGTIGAERVESRSEPQINDDNFVAELNLDYNLYKFGGTSDRVKALKTLKAEQIKSANYSNKKIEIQIKREFYEALYIREILEMTKSELKYNATLKKQVKNRKSAGLVGNADVLEIEMREATLKNKVIELEEELKHAKDRIRKLTFLSHGQEIILKGEIQHEHFDAKEHELVEAAMLKNRELAQNKAKLTSLKYELDSSKMARLPELNIRGQYGKLKAYQRLTSDSVEGVIGIYVDIPLFDGGTKSSGVELYKARLAQQQMLVKKNSLELEINVAHSYEKMMSIHKQVDLGEINVKRSEVYFKNVLSEYRRGVKNSIDLVSARDRLINFKDELILHKMKFLVAKANLEEVTGASFK